MIVSTGAYPQFLSLDSTRLKLQQRAEVLAVIRAYFLKQGVLEVETPALGQYAVTDPQLGNLQVIKPFPDTVKDAYLYLQTSPEYAMKNLLAKESGSIFQICKAFREDQPGKLHALEFTLLEWYRLDYTLNQLMQDVVGLVTAVIGETSVSFISYREAFIRFAGIDPFEVTPEKLCKYVRSRVDVDIDDSDKDVSLDVLLTHFVEPQLGRGELTFLTDYPSSQAALSRVKTDSSGHRVAERFELYIHGIEIANGYHELTGLDEHLLCFERDNAKRVVLNKTPVEIDPHFIAAVKTGIPDCSGVALGVDRLIYCAENLP